MGPNEFKVKAEVVNQSDHRPQTGARVKGVGGNISLDWCPRGEVQRAEHTLK